MKYADGSKVSLVDIVNVPVPDGTAKARVVMLGDTYGHLDIDPGFVTLCGPNRGNCLERCAQAKALGVHF
jgi:hypothetical protein